LRGQTILVSPTDCQQFVPEPINLRRSVWIKTCDTVDSLGTAMILSAAGATADIFSGFPARFTAGCFCQDYL